MRGTPDPQLAMLTTVSTEELIPSDHPFRKIRVVVDAVLAELDPVFDEMYATSGRRSVPPEMLLKSAVLMAMYSIRSERAFCERPNYDLLFESFLDMRIDQPAFDATTLTTRGSGSRPTRARGEPLVWGGSFRARLGNCSFVLTAPLIHDPDFEWFGRER